MDDRSVDEVDLLELRSFNVSVKCLLFRFRVSKVSLLLLFFEFAVLKTLIHVLTLGMILILLRTKWWPSKVFCICRGLPFRAHFLLASKVYTEQALDGNDFSAVWSLFCHFQPVLESVRLLERHFSLDRNCAFLLRCCHNTMNAAVMA